MYLKYKEYFFDILGTFYFLFYVPIIFIFLLFYLLINFLSFHLLFLFIFFLLYKKIPAHKMCAGM